MCVRGGGGAYNCQMLDFFFSASAGFSLDALGRRQDHITSHASSSSALTYPCSPGALWSAPDHLRPPHSLLQLHQPLFVLVAFHQHSGHLHPGEALPLGCRQVALWQHALTLRVNCGGLGGRGVYMRCRVKYSHPLHLYFCFSCPPPQVALWKRPFIRWFACTF